MTVSIEGLDGLLSALQELPKRSTEKAVVRRSLKKSAEPVRALWASLAPYDPEDPYFHLRDAIIISPKTKSRQTLEGARPGDVTIYIGPDKSLPHHHGVFMEFGTFKDSPQPSGRPAWAARKDEAFSILGYWMWVEIDATARRLAARLAKV